MDSISKEDLEKIDLIYLVDMVLNDKVLSKIDKINLLTERKLQLFNNLKYHNVTKEMRKDMNSCIKYIEEKLTELKSNKLT